MKVPPPAASNAKCPYELIHPDLSGKFSVQSLGISYYYLSLIDDKTRFTWVCFLREKSDAVKCIMDFVKECKTQAQVTVSTITGGILRFRTDGSGEYVNKELREFFQSEGIIHEMSPPYSHESNGIAEQFNRTITTMARAMLSNGNLPLSLWSEAINMAVYLKNRIPHKAVKESTPYEALYGNKPLIQHLQPFRRKCYVHIPEEQRGPGSKLLPRALEGKFIGYTESTKIFRIYILSQHKVAETRQVRFTP